MSRKTIALVGNPNCGKTTIFNALTGAHQSVGNWSGVTVERVSGHFQQNGQSIELIDLPGIYSLTTLSEAIDEKIAADYILSQQADLMINIVDASSLERHLYLTVQLLELGLPVILAVNMMDVARSQHTTIDLPALSRQLGCPVVPLEARRGVGLDELRKAMTAIVSKGQQQDAPVFLEMSEDTDIAIATARYQYIQQLLNQCVTKSAAKPSHWTSTIDNIVLNKFLGIPIFLGVMYLLFVFAINIGGFFQTYFNTASQTIFVDGFSAVLTNLHLPNGIVTLLANGVGQGLTTVISFIPVIAAMYLFLALLEDSGYMARAAFVVDRLMRVIGLPGKAFVPLIVGFGCNVPAVLAARTLPHPRDRILTILMSPFMSCGARLAIYAVFTAAFFPVGGQNIVFALYLIGILMAIFTGLLLQRTVLKGEATPLVMELPAYHLPNSRTLILHAWQRLKGFVLRAGKLIVPICMFIGVLNTGIGDAHSILSVIGQSITPIFSPMGIHADNWPATVGLLTGVLAKEVVVGTLNTLYAQMHVGALYQQFDGQMGAFAYLLFVLLYFPCVSTMAVMLRELHRGWTVFSAVWMMYVAYAVSVIFYQGATFYSHPFSSFMWISGLIGAFLLSIYTVSHFIKFPLPIYGERGRGEAPCFKTCPSKCFKCPAKL